MTERVLLTGAGGFVGSHVLRHLLTNTDWHLVCPVTFTHRGVADRIRLAVEDHPEWAPRITVVRHDLATPVSPVTARTWGRITHCVNVASESHVDRSIAEPASFVLNNVALVCHLLDWARQQDHLETFLQVSTDEVYGPAPAGHNHAEWEGHRPSNPYSASKAAQEDIAFSYWRTYGVPLVLTNTMNIVGEMQDAEKYVPMVLRQVLRGETVPIHASPDGATVGSRFYLHARNQADALLHVLTKLRPVPYGTAELPSRWHVVGEREIDNLDMARLIADAAGRPLHYGFVDFHSSRPGHDLRYALDGSKLAATGWRAPLSLEESLARTVHWTMRHPEWLGLTADEIAA